MACTSLPFVCLPSPSPSRPSLKVTAPTMLEPSVSVKKPSYKVVRELGSGLQGRVMLAFDQNERTPVAIKMPSAFVKPGMVPAEDQQRLLNYQIQSIVQERHAHQYVKHENVLRYKRLVPGKKNGQSYVAMVTEFAENGDMFDIVADTGALSEDAAKFYFAQLLRGLQACHRNGVVHRDIKPENILLDENFTLKICDFGLACVCPTKASAHDTLIHGVSGTSLYLAPEVSEHRRFRGAPVDVWSAGVVLFILLTSFPPFQKASMEDYWYRNLVQGRQDLFWKHQPEARMLSNQVKDLINGMLTANPDKRLTVDELLKHPWLQDVDRIDRVKITTEMRARKTQSFCLRRHR